MTTERLSRILIFTALALTGLALAATAAADTLLTTTGQVIRGSISGLSASIRLTEPDEISTLQPVTARDIDLADILQITIDYPRIAIETSDNVFVGPYSAFSGIGESLRVDTGIAASEVPTSGVRAVALAGHSLRQPPRVWLGDGYLTMPLLRVSGGVVESAASEAVEDEPTFDPIVWNSFTPTEPVAADEGTIPWWVGLLVVVGIVALLLFMSG